MHALARHRKLRERLLTIVRTASGGRAGPGGQMHRRELQTGQLQGGTGPEASSAQMLATSSDAGILNSLCSIANSSAVALAGQHRDSVL